jgi:hypothetical protein
LDNEEFGTQVHADSIDFSAIAEFVIGPALAVPNTPRTGFLEEMHEHVPAHELRKAGFEIGQLRL